MAKKKSILLQTYGERLSFVRFSVLSLVIKHSKNIFYTFNATSVNTANIGNVHIVEKDGKKLAMKTQYTGVAESIASDITITNYSYGDV